MQIGTNRCSYCFYIMKTVSYTFILLVNLLKSIKIFTNMSISVVINIMIAANISVNMLQYRDIFVKSTDESSRISNKKYFSKSTYIALNCKKNY